MSRPISISVYQEYQKEKIAEMMAEIASEFEQPIFVSRTESVKIIPDNYWVATCDQEVVGTIAISKKENHCAILTKMFVRKGYRGKEIGLSQNLLQTALKWSRDQGIKHIFLGTMTQFVAAQKFYEKNGFEKINEDELPSDYIKNPLDSIYYRYTI